MRGTPTDMTWVHQPLGGRGLVVKSFIVYLLRTEVADWNNFMIHKGLLNRTPKITSTHTHRGIKNKRHDESRIYLEVRKTIKEEKEIARATYKM